MALEGGSVLAAALLLLTLMLLTLRSRLGGGVRRVIECVAWLEAELGSCLSWRGRRGAPQRLPSDVSPVISPDISPVKLSTLDDWR